MDRIKVRFKTNTLEYENDYLDIVRAFYPHIVLSDDEDANIINVYYVSKKSTVVIKYIDKSHPVGS